MAKIPRTRETRDPASAPVDKTARQYRIETLEDFQVVADFIGGQRVWTRSSAGFLQSFTAKAGVDAQLAMSAALSDIAEALNRIARAMESPQ